MDGLVGLLILVVSFVLLDWLLSYWLVRCEAAGEQPAPLPVSRAAEGQDGDS